MDEREKAKRAVLRRRKIARLAHGVMGQVPVGVLKRAAGVEKTARILAGKGGGAHTLEAEVTAAIAFLSPRDNIVIDAGANRGDWTINLLQAAGSRIAQVYAFEPQPEHFDALLSLDPSKVTLVRSALGREDGVGTLFATRPGVTSASLHAQRRHASHESTRDVTITGMTTFVTERGIDRVDFLKMDVEGHEVAVLEGAQELLASGRIRALSFEFGEANVASRTFFEDFWHLLTPLGYRIFRIVPGGRLLEVTRYGRELECFFCSNYIAARHVPGSDPKLRP